MTTTKDDNLQEVGKNALASIREMIAALECDYERLEELREAVASDEFRTTEEDEAEREELAELIEAAGECESREDAEQRIQEDALSLRIFGERVDGEWQADRFELLLTTGGPAVRIMGELDANSEPDRAWLEVQDWGTPWTQYYEPGVGDLCLTYARCFCFE